MTVDDADFPLRVHRGSGQWYRKVKGRFAYFGAVESDPTGERAYAEYVRQLPFLQAGETPPPKSNKPARPPKRPQPIKGSPLRAASNGMWIWYHRGEAISFGPWRTVSAAEAEAARQRYLKTGLRPGQAELTVNYAVNSYVDELRAKVQTQAERTADGPKARRRSPKTVGQYERAGALMIECLGRHRPLESIPYREWLEFRESVEKDRAAYSVRGILTSVRTILTHARKIAERHGITISLQVSDALAPPSAEELKDSLRKREPKFFTRENINAILEVAGPQAKAITLLCLNCGFHNLDIALLEFSHLDGERIMLPRSKTSRDRFCFLWDETRDAIDKWIEIRPDPLPPYGERMFVKDAKTPWVRGKDDVSHLTKFYNETLTLAKVKRHGISLGSLRHTFRTAAEMLGHSEAAKLIMGHAEPTEDMGRFYIAHLDPSLVVAETAEEKAVRSCCDAVHDWVFTPTDEQAQGEQDAA